MCKRCKLRAHMGSTNVIFLRVFVTPNGPRETSCVQCESPLGGHSLTMLTKFFPLLTTPLPIPSWHCTGEEIPLRVRENLHIVDTSTYLVTSHISVVKERPPPLHHSKIGSYFSLWRWAKNLSWYIYSANWIYCLMKLSNVLNYIKIWWA